MKNKISGKIKKLKKNSTIQLVNWWTISFIINFLILHHLHFTLFRSFFEAFVTNGLLFIFSLIIRQILNYYQTKEVIRLSNIGLVASLSFIHLLISFKLNSIVFGDDFASKIKFNPEFIYKFLFVYFLLFLTFFQLWMDKFKLLQEKTMQKVLEIERQLNQAELKNIQQQLQPHFLFNSLNSISALTIIKPEEARRMIQLLSDFLRGTLTREKENVMSFKEEIAYLNLYLEIEKVRFGHRLNVEFLIDNLCDSAKIPALILQPIVENAIKYGLYGQTEAITIKVEAKCFDNILQVSISNPYSPETEKTSKGVGFGLTSVKKKMFLLFGQNDLLFIDKNQNTFTTTIKIPQI